MPTLLVRFPGGRYHATPWGHHVNEALVEWPPSPWRLLRALIACGYATQHWGMDVPPTGRRLIEALASVAPTYRVPRASVAHSRHYMPVGVIEKGRGQEKTTLVFDAWADVGDGTLAVRWPCRLDEEATALFATLAASLGYLGRAESWALAEAIADDAALPAGEDVVPHVDGDSARLGREQVFLFAPEVPSAYGVWRAQAEAAALEPFPLPGGKRAPSAALKKNRERAQAPFPDDIVACLQKDTAWWKQHCWSQPPGSRRLLYWRPAEVLNVGVPATPRPGSSGRPTAVLLAMTTSSGRTSSLPTLSRVLPQAELIHRSLVSVAGRGQPVDCQELTGRDGTGRPLVGHRHAHVLPLDLDGDGRLDHVLIWAEMGLGPVAQEAVRSLRRTWTKGGSGPIQLALAGQGELHDLRSLPAGLAPGVARVLGPSHGAREWTSATPFVAPRYPKPRGANSIEGQVVAELMSRGLPAATVAVLPWDDANRHFRHAVRVRRHPAKRPPVDACVAVRLVFDTPVSGPIALGYGAHFGLGLFAATGELEAGGSLTTE